MKQTTESKILIAHLYNRLSFIMCNSEVELEKEVKADNSIQELVNMLDNAYTKFAESKNNSKTKIIKKSNQ